MDRLEQKGKVQDRFLPDSSVILSGQLLDYLKSIPVSKKIELVLSRVVLAEIENKANQDKTSGFIGIEMLNDIISAIENEFSTNGKTIIIIPHGQRPSLEQIKLNTGGELDAIIRQHTSETGSTLITSEKIQYDMAKIEQLPVLYLPKNETTAIKIKKIQEYFDEHSMSVHLKVDCFPMAKKGSPGHWKLVKIGEEKLTSENIRKMESMIISEVKKDPESFIEKELPGVTVVQLKNYRIVICSPPFADTYEITAVKPLVKLKLDYYNKIDALINRLEKAEGILVAGSPGAGKSTFISALTDFYLARQKIVKTLQSVRDLQVPPEVSQYTDLEGDFEKTADILLLLRPDFTIFDEVRTSGDFKIFADLRLAGVGMVGVIHASSALDAIQRFIRRVELGIIPSIIDTVIFIKDGQIDNILKLEITVKVPSGFRDEGLARPVIEIADFITNKLMYEIYEFGSNIIVSPVGKRKIETYNSDTYRPPSSYSNRPNRGRPRKGKKDNSNDRKYHYSEESHQNKNDEGYGTDDEDLEDVEGKSIYQQGNFASGNARNPLINKEELLKSKNSEQIVDEDKGNDSDQNTHPNIDEFEESGVNKKTRLEFDIIFGKKSLVLRAGTYAASLYIDLYAGSEFIASYQINKFGELRIEKTTHLYHKIENAIQDGKNVYGVLSK
jgi:ATPase